MENEIPKQMVTKHIILSIQIIYEEHFSIKEDEVSRKGEKIGLSETKMHALDNIHQTLSLELPAASRETLPDFLKQKEYEGRISLSTCSHSCVTISKQHVMAALSLHRQGQGTQSASNISKLEAAIKVDWEI